MLSLEAIINKLKYQIDTNTSKIGFTDISEASSDNTLTTGLVEADTRIKNIDLKMGTQVTYRIELQNNGDYYLYIDTWNPFAEEENPDEPASPDNPDDSGGSDNPGNPDNPNDNPDSGNTDNPSDSDDINSDDTGNTDNPSDNTGDNTNTDNTDNSGTDSQNDQTTDPTANP